MRMRRRRRLHKHANHERWLVSYADFVTLLFAFFVVLYASSQVDKRKAGKLALAIQNAFQEMGAFPASTTQVPVDINSRMPFSTVQSVENVNRNVDRTTELGRVSSPPNSSLSGASAETEVSTLRSEIEQALHGEIERRAVEVHGGTEGLVVSLREFGFFDSGSTTIKPEAMPALDRVAAILAIRTYKLRIEGHTDNVPIHTARIGSNWELSTGRATELVRLLIDRYRFSPERLSAAGYADYHPIASNATPQGRAQNRRVDIVILTGQDARPVPA